MEIDRERALAAFESYVDGFDMDDPKVSLKAEHTYRVADLAERIARAQLAGDEGAASVDRAADLAWLLGLLHDVGRFEQVRTWGTFNDAASASHADLGVKVLFEGFRGASPTIRDYVEDDSEDELVRTAVALHSSWHLPADQDERTRFYCQVLRDADKLDILQVNCTRPVEDIYGYPEEHMLRSELSEESASWFWRHSTIPRAARHHPADVLLGHICFIWDLCYPESYRIAVEQGFVFRMLERPWVRPDTREEFARMEAHLKSWLAEEGYLPA